MYSEYKLRPKHLHIIFRNIVVQIDVNMFKFMITLNTVHGKI